MIKKLDEPPQGPSKYASKGGSYRYSYEHCKHDGEPIWERYIAQTGPHRSHFKVRCCGSCGVILGQAVLEWKEE